jgi:hypothetical protein
MPVASVERNALDQGWLSDFNHRVIRQAGDEGAHLELGDGCRLRGGGAGRDAAALVVRQPIPRGHEPGVVSGEHFVDNRDLRQVLDPIGAEVSRHDQLERIAVEKGQLLAVHVPGKQHVRTGRDVEVQRLDERRCAGEHRRIESSEGHLFGARRHAGLVQHGFQRNSRPACIAHRAVAKLRAEHAWIGESPAVSRALIDGHDLDGRRQRAQLRHRQRQLGADLAAHFEPVCRQVDRQRNIGEVVAHKEGVICRDDALVEYRKWSFQMRWTGGDPQQRPLLRIGDQLSLAVCEGLRLRRGHAAERPAAGRSQRDARVAQEAPPPNRLRPAVRTVPESHRVLPLKSRAHCNNS